MVNAIHLKLVMIIKENQLLLQLILIITTKITTIALKSMEPKT